MKGQISIMFPDKGDVKAEWDSDVATEVEAARATFNKLVTEKKYAAFKLKGSGAKGEQIRAFDPEAEKIVMIPPMAGG